MLKQGDIGHQYASYEALKDSNCIGMTCLTSSTIDNYHISIKGQKVESQYAPIQHEDIHETQEEEDEACFRLKETFEESLREELKDPFEHSIFKVYRKSIWFGILIAQFGSVCHYITPLLLYYIYCNIVEGKIRAPQNQAFVIAVVICRVFRVFCCYYGDIQQNKAGLKMYRLAANAILKKTILCSPITNKNISAAGLSNMMHADCSVMLLYPSKLSCLIENLVSFVLLSGIIIFVSGLPGIIGILCIAGNLIFRYVFKKIINKVDKDLNICTKARVRFTIEVFNIIKFIKANALQSCYFNKLRQLRVNEVIELKTKLLMEIIQNIVVMISKPLIVVLVVKLLTIQDKLNLQVLFTVNICIIIINMQAILNAHSYIEIIQGSIRNIEEFMQQKEMDLSHVIFTDNTSGRYAIEIEDGNFQWSDNSEQKGDEPPNEELHLRNINLKINRGELVTLIGTYGSGKTSLVNCLLGEMNRIGSPSVKVNGSIAYASQVPWIMNDTFRNNILFGREYDYKRYSEAVKFASLESDLLLFPHGDLEIIGKRGSTLSGGQRARLALARALYSDADIYIFDDILSAVDAHVGAFLFSMTIKRLLKHKTVLLITHSLYYVSYSDRIIIFEEGEIKQEGSYDELCKSPHLMKIEASQLRSTKDFESILSTTLEFAQPEKFTKKIEEAEEESVSLWDSFKVYIRRNSGTPFAIIMVIFIFVLSGITTNTQINLNRWALSPEAKDNFYVYLQLILNGLKVVITLLLAGFLHYSRFFQSIHDDAIKSLLFCPLSYYQKVPSEKIVNRLSNDLSINDKIITVQFAFLLTNLQLFLSHFLGIVYVYFIFGNFFHLVFLLIVASLTYYIFDSYFSLSFKISKLEQELIIPINTKYSELLDGLPVIRAYKKMQYILDCFWNKMNIYSTSAVLRYITDGKVKLLIYISTNLLALINILATIYFDDSFKKYTVFLIFNYFALEDTIQRFYTSLSAFAPRLESLGKCEQLTTIEPQQGYRTFLDNCFRENEKFQKIYFGAEIFPKGEIVFKDFSLRYNPDSEDVLKGLSFTISPGEKIGIVGRTGSGKSTMMLGLLRILEASGGSIEIDGMDISKLSLEELRSNVNIIMQDHFMFSGTVRENVDPTGSHTDEQVIEALKLSGIWTQFADKEGVHSEVAEGGENLSSGEKQLLNISRSLLSPKRIVLIDEATASIDIETDALIQKVIKRQFADKTVLTIAHRINTVVESDRILVLNKGQIAEFDSPVNLLQRENSIFAKLYNESGKAKLEERGY